MCAQLPPEPNIFGLRGTPHSADTDFLLTKLPMPVSKARSEAPASP